MSKEVVIIKESSRLFPLFLVFLVLKLTGVIGWSWWWVTIPLWIGPAIAITFFLIAAFTMMLMALVACLLG